MGIILKKKQGTKKKLTSNNKNIIKKRIFAI
jgi:hypothetical protein